MAAVGRGSATQGYSKGVSALGRAYVFLIRLFKGLIVFGIFGNQIVRGLSSWVSLVGSSVGFFWGFVADFTRGLFSR